jgi:hypothetical protein
MEAGKKILYGLMAIIFLNYGVNLIMSFFITNNSAYSDYITWASFLIIMWMFLPSSSPFNFEDSK